VLRDDNGSGGLRIGAKPTSARPLANSDAPPSEPRSDSLGTSLRIIAILVLVRLG